MAQQQNQTNSSAMNLDPRLKAIYDETVAFENKIGVIIPTIFAFIIFVGLVGNTLVVLVVGLNRAMRNSTNSLIINLALSDLIFLLICVPFTAADYALPIWVFPEWWCSLLNYFQYCSAYASVWTLVLMSIDRFLAVVYPVKSLTLRNTKNTSLAILLLWLFIFSANIPIYFEHRIFSYRFFFDERSVCTYYKKAKHMAAKEEVWLFYYSFNFFGYFLPLSVTCALYCVFLRKLWGMSRPGHELRNKKNESLKAKKKVTWMVLGVIVTFAVCWLPLNICFFLTAFYFPDSIKSYLFLYAQIGAQVLAYCNSCLNPILYAFLSENFRQGFLRLLQVALLCLKCRGTSALKQHLRLTRTGSFLHTTAYGGGYSSKYTPSSARMRRSLSRSGSGNENSGPDSLLLPPRNGVETGGGTDPIHRKSPTDRIVQFQLPDGRKRTSTFSNSNSSSHVDDYQRYLGRKATLAVPLLGTDNHFNTQVNQTHLGGHHYHSWNGISESFPTPAAIHLHQPILIERTESQKSSGKRSSSLEESPSQKRRRKSSKKRRNSRVLHSADFDVMFSNDPLSHLTHPKIVLTEFDSEEYLDVREIELFNTQV